MPITYKLLFSRLPRLTSRRTATRASIWSVQSRFRSVSAIGHLLWKITTGRMSTARAGRRWAGPSMDLARAYWSEPRLGLDRTQPADDRQFVGGARHSRRATRCHCVPGLVAARLFGL